MSKHERGRIMCNRQKLVGEDERHLRWLNGTFAYMHLKCLHSCHCKIQRFLISIKSLVINVKRCDDRNYTLSVFLKALAIYRSYNHHAFVICRVQHPPFNIPVILYTTRTRPLSEKMFKWWCLHPVYIVRLAGKQARKKRARGRESCVVIIDQEDGNSTESLSL